MKRKIFLLMGVTVLSFLNNVKADESLDAVRAKYNERLQVINSGFEKQKKEMFEKYDATLVALEEKIKAKGDLDGILVVRKEAERFKKEQDLSVTNIVGSAGNLQEVQQICLSMYDDLLVVWAGDVVKLCGLYDAALAKQEKTFTSNDKVKLAIEVRNERDRVIESTELSLSRKILVKKHKETKQSAPIKIESKISFDMPVVEGFGKIISAPNSGNYPNHRSIPATAYWTYSGKEQFVEWKTTRVPSNYMASDVIFVWCGSNSNTLGEFDLFFNDKKVLTFNSQQKSTKKWSLGNIIFEFRHINNKADNSGLFVLRVPSDLVEKGRTQTIRVDARTKEKSMAWIMIYNFADAKKEYK